MSVPAIRHLILDRDGVLNRELDSSWLEDPSRWEWERGSLEALQVLARAGVGISVVSNQSGIGRGLVAAERIDRLHRWLADELAAAGVELVGIYVCPHAPDAGCSCRKPEPGLVLRAIAASGVAAGETLMVGDDLRDLEAGRSAGVAVALVRTGKGVRVESRVPPDTAVFDDLRAVAAVIAERASPSPSATKESSLLREQFEEHGRVLERMRDTQLPALEQAAAVAEACLRAGGRILVFGNGGSAADAQHFAAELEGRFEVDRPPLAAVALTVNSSTLTAVGNDFGFEHVFSRQVEALGRTGDVAVAISTSGNSPNVLEAARSARAIGCKLIGFTGEGGGELAQHCDVLIAVPSATVSRVQEMHELCLHALAGWLERRLCTVGNAGS